MILILTVCVCWLYKTYILPADKVIKKIEFKLIFINDYFNVQFRIRIKKEVKENLSFFLSSN